MTTITDKEEKVIYDSKQSLLSDGGSTWKKKGDPNFYIQMGSWEQYFNEHQKSSGKLKMYFHSVGRMEGRNDAFIQL